MGFRNKEGEDLLDFCVKTAITVGNTWHGKRKSQTFTGIAEMETIQVWLTIY